MNGLRWTVERFDPESGPATAVWSELALAAGGSPVCLPEFVFSCARSMAKGRLHFAVCRRDATAVAAVVLQGVGSMSPEVFVTSQMPLGAWVQRPGEDFTALLKGLAGVCGPALRIGAWQIDPRFVSRPAEGSSVHTLDYIETAWVELEGTFDAYWAARGKNLRVNMRKQRDKLSVQGVRTRMEILTAPGDIAHGVSDYAALESAGWKSELGTAVSTDHPQFEFYRSMLTRFAERGTARIYRYFFDDRLVATELCLVGGSEMVILKTTHDETVHPYSPASLLRQEMIADLFAQGQVRRVEFYGPRKDWHKRWTECVRTIFHANVYRYPVVHRIARALRKGFVRHRNAAAAAQPGGWRLIPIAGHFDDFAARWDELNEKIYHGHPLFDSRFVGPLVRHFGTDSTRLALLGDARNPRGMLLIERANPVVWRTFLPSQWQIAPVLLASEDAGKLRELFAVLPMSACVLDLLRQDRRFSPMFGPAAQNLVLDVKDHSASMRVALDGSFDHYWKERGQRLRKNIRKYLNHASEHASAVECRVRTDPEAVADGVRDYGLLESAGWKGAEGTAVHPDNVQGAFYRDALRRFALDGQALFSELYLGDELAAARLIVRSSDMIVILKTTHRESLRDFAPGRVHLHFVLRRLFETYPGAGVEFYTNADVNQLAWATEKVEICDVSVYRTATDCWIVRLLRVAHMHASRLLRKLERLNASLNAVSASDQGPRRGWRADLRALGALGYTFHILNRLIAGPTGSRCRLMGVWFYAQPVGQTDRAGTAMDNRTVIGVAEPGAIPEVKFGRPEGVVEQRFRDGSVCITAQHDGELAGFMWMHFGPLTERLVRCVFEQTPTGTTSWDYDFFVAPRFRMGRTFARLWDCANRYLRERGVESTGSWIAFTNRGSALAHERLGARRVGWAVFVTIGKIQVVIASVSPYLHLSMRGGHLCRLRIPLLRK